MAKLALFLIYAMLMCLATSTLISEGKIDGDDRLRDPQIRDCLDSKPCPITLDYSPTCGSDGKTYSNRRVIYCLNECLKPEEKVEIVSGGFCKAKA
ncbi:uncharacterized protein LOC123672771 isoform X2 [Harmonia axyridis]|uniref:uncharacterized protein LOC123672771 isoform X2 n=1 Tax=Harmonia axyridis TaxID=115357 RepID=UPI001E278CD5|nr:uncharacterized protein LOC123672771 isoform X2 [Harmonia axyridis]